ncbi:DUF2312 domain-containing protein [Sphingomonas cavernae]|uniref:DUF2312 domain-containing protein n=2 Tax=Sphingomonas cavernae TaxID=2320861 RepID=A0A418WSI7_9SPHN|nr:DUF2312 domain-containing protein [Sphingomonas cavernae]
MGGIRHVLRPAPPPAPANSRGKKKRHVPDPIKANPESAAQQLRLFIERLERMDEEIRGMQDDRKDVLNEAKANGYDTKTIGTILKLRQLDPNNRMEAEALLETYKASLGIE